MYDPNPKRESAVTPQSLREKYGIGPERFLDVQALMGDSTDNIPGVPGVGEKTAVKLITEFGGLDQLYQRLDQVKQKKLKEKLEQNRDGAYLSRELARLKSDADLGLDLPDLAVADPDAEALRAWYNDLEFTKFAAELGPERSIGYERYRLVTTEDELAAMLEQIQEADRLSVDLETTSLNPMRADIVGVALADRPGRAWYLPVGHQVLGGPQLDFNTAITRLQPVLEADRPAKVGQNLKYDYVVFQRHQIHLVGVTDDAMIASYLIDPGGGHGLDRLARQYLGHDTIKYEDVVADKKAGFASVPAEAAKDYACEDADVALRLVDHFRPLMDQAGLTALYRDVEIPLLEVLADMEINGVLVDPDRLDQLAEKLGRDMKASEEKVFELAGRTFNVNSPRQLGQVLFEELGLPQGKKTKKKSGYSTDVEVLKELSAQHPLPAEVLNYRGLKKMLSTYVEALAALIHPLTGRVHTSFNQAVTATGRLSSSDPNLQNIPIRTETGRKIREAFIAAPGCVLLSADYSQIELRVLAHYSGDRAFLEAFASRQDIHTRTAAEIFGVQPSEVTPQMRREAKAINFGIVYGLGAYGLSRQLDIERKTAKSYIDQYFQRYAGVKNYIEQTLTQARQNGYVTTLLGRRRPLPELESKNHQARAQAERMAINTPIQGSAADLIKLAMLAVHRKLTDGGFRTKMILQVHDELVFEAPEEELSRVTEMVRQEMEQVHPLETPLLVDINHGHNWAEAH
jgi:DNA polymerase-1